VGLTSCAGPVVDKDKVGSAAFYWSAAKETYAAGDYMKTADHLERLIDSKNEYTQRAIPWYLVVTSGMAAGYMQLADQYASGARVNKADALAFLKRTSDYRERANRLTLRFAQNVDKLEQMALGRLPLAFDLPKGSAAPPALLTRIARGKEFTPADADAVEKETIEHNVLMAVCMVAGAPNDMAKAEGILNREAAGTPRAAFLQTIANMLDAEAVLYSRNKLDMPDKFTALQKRAQNVREEAARMGGVRVVQVGANQPPTH
jgi:hypothetical protein